jgi:ligand-binding sensor domain-containing protein
MNYSLRARRWSGLFALLLLTIGAAVAQSTVGYGDWQLHLPNNRAYALADAGNRVYVATDDAFFFYDKELNTTQLLSSRDGLSDVGVNALGYDPTTKQVLVAYRSGNLDALAADGSIINISDIKRKQIAGGKTISHISFSKGVAYLSTSFGLVVLDMAKHEIRDTYSSIGPAGAAVTVYATAVLNNMLFAATSAGVMRGLLTDNLLDYRRWTIDLPAATSSGRVTYTALAAIGNQVYTGANFSTLLCYNCNGPSWQPVYAVYGEEYSQLTASGAGLLIAGSSNGERTLRLLKADNTVSRIGTAAQVPSPRTALQDQNGDFYIADLQNGLLKTSDQRQFEKFVTNAPAFSRSFNILTDSRTNTVDVFSGGYSTNYAQQEWTGGFFEYKAGQWTSFTNAGFTPTPALPIFKDVTRGARTADGTLYLATYGSGLLKWKGPWEFEQFTDGTPGSPLKSDDALGDPKYTRVTDLATDAAGNVWVVNRHIQQYANVSGLHVYTPATNSWQTTPYFRGFENLDRVAIDNNGYVWVSQARRGGLSFAVAVYDPETQDARFFDTGNSDLPAGEIYDITKDRKGDIWVATSRGIALFADPSSVFLPTGAGTFQHPFIRHGVSTGFRALFNEVVKTVAVDGANRKWFGTERGLWLFSEDADEDLQHFTMDNSPLPSNNIIDVAVNDRTGEVYVATDAGLVSYRGSASVTEGKPDCAKVSPNPVRTNFTGQVGISGLANNGMVKITDVTGKLVYQTRASGGTVVWNLADYNGRKVQSGVYLVLSADADGKNGCVSKIAVVEK